jgi:hypothetical protein
LANSKHQSTARPVAPELREHSGVTLVGKQWTGIGGFSIDKDSQPRAEFNVKVLKKDQEITTAKTDADGFFLIRLQPGGPYKIRLYDPNTNELVASAKVQELAKHQFVRVRWKNRK